jgi:hypothetical protein
LDYLRNLGLSWCQGLHLVLLTVLVVVWVVVTCYH